MRAAFLALALLAAMAASSAAASVTMRGIIREYGLVSGSAPATIKWRTSPLFSQMTISGGGAVIRLSTFVNQRTGYISHTFNRRAVATGKGSWRFTGRTWKIQTFGISSAGTGNVASSVTIGRFGVTGFVQYPGGYATFRGSVRR